MLKSGEALCLVVLCCRGGVCPSIYTPRRGDVVAIPSVKPMHHRLLHGGMQLPHEGEDEQCQVGGGWPLIGSYHYRLSMVGR